MKLIQVLPLTLWRMRLLLLMLSRRLVVVLWLQRPCICMSNQVIVVWIGNAVGIADTARPTSNTIAHTTSSAFGFCSFKMLCIMMMVPGMMAGIVGIVSISVVVVGGVRVLHLQNYFLSSTPLYHDYRNFVFSCSSSPSNQQYTACRLGPCKASLVVASSSCECRPFNLLPHLLYFCCRLFTVSCACIRVPFSYDS